MAHDQKTQHARNSRRPICRKAGPKAERIWSGRAIGRWTVIRPLGYPVTGCLVVLARCACGKTKPVESNNLLNGTSTQCGDCGRRDSTRSLRERCGKARAEAGVLTPLGERPKVRCACGGLRNPRCAGCKKCANAAAAGKPRKFPESISVVAQRFGVSKQRVSQLIAERGWTRMLAFFQAKQGAAA